MKYVITAEGTDTATRSDKTAAIAFADAAAKETKIETTVTTEKGTIVHVARVRKAQKSTARFTRVDSHDLALAEGVSIPAGWDVAYARVRTNVALLRRVSDDTVAYVVFDATTGAVVDAEDTRDAGRIMREMRIAARKSDLELVV